MTDKEKEVIREILATVIQGLHDVAGLGTFQANELLKRLYESSISQSTEAPSPEKTS